MVEKENSEASRLEEAALWYAQMEDGVADRAAFELWRAVPENAVAFAKVSDSSDWFDGQKHQLPDDFVQRELAKSLSRRNLMLAAATVTGGALVAGGLFAGFNPPRAEAATGVGDHSSIALPDGGRIELNTDSKIYWRFTGKVRRVWLERGEIAVTALDDQRPFVLTTGDADVLLTKGIYSVRRRRDASDVLVVSGACSIKSTGSGRPLRVQAGQATEAAGGTSSVKTMTQDEIERSTAWRNNELVFDGVPLSDAVAEYNRYLKRKIVINNSEIGKLKIGGRFTTQDPTEFLTALRSSFALTVSDDGKNNIQIAK